MANPIERRKSNADIESEISASKIRVAIARDIKNSNVASTANTVHTRNLNDIVGDTGIASIDGNGVNVPAGTYKLEAYGMIYKPNHSKLYIYNVTDGVYLDLDTSMHYDDNTDNGSAQRVSTESIATFTKQTKLELRQWVQAALSNGLSGSIQSFTNDPGNATSVVAAIKITRLGD